MTTMQRISYNEVDRTYYNVNKDSIFICEDIGDDKTFEGVVNKFKNFRFDEQFINEIREEFECQSYSHLVFFLKFEEKDESTDIILLFSSVLEISSRHESEYYLHFCEDIETLDRRKNHVNNRFKLNNYNKHYVKVMMDTRFFINRGLDIVDQYDDERYDEEEEELPAIIELPFISDNCSICLSAIPNILNIPCLHLSVCSQCEEIGKLLKCSVCRKKIERKVKI